MLRQAMAEIKRRTGLRSLAFFALIVVAVVRVCDAEAQVAPPAVTSISPASGPVTGGTGVTISGSGFAGARTVSFGAVRATFTIISATSISAATPAGAGTVDVTVTGPGGTSRTSTADQFTYVSPVSPPIVTSISPRSGPAAGGTSVTISGSNLGDVTSVRFGAAAALFVVNSSNSITATAPAGSGVVDITVSTPGGTSATSPGDQFTYLPAPVVSSISPNSGPPSGGTSVTISGNNFTGVSDVRFGNTTAVFNVNSPTSITATAPAGTGTVSVTVTTTGGTSATITGSQFSYIGAPSVTSVSPASGSANGGTSVVIAGDNFQGVTGVSFGGISSPSFTVKSPSSITAISPSGSGTVDVTVTTSVGTSAATLADRFTYSGAPTQVSLTSSANPSSTGRPVTFTAVVTGSSPSGSVSFLDSTVPIGRVALVSGSATLTLSNLRQGTHSITAKYEGDAINAGGISPVLVQMVEDQGDSIKLRQMQLAMTPVIAQISGQAIRSSMETAIEIGFSGGPIDARPNGTGVTFIAPLGQSPLQDPSQLGRSRIDTRQVRTTATSNARSTGSLATATNGGNGAPFGVRLIDMPAIPLPAGPMVPPPGETRFAPNEIQVQFASDWTAGQIANFAQRFDLSLLERPAIAALGRAIHVFKIMNGRPIRNVLRQIEASGLKAIAQPNYIYGLTQNQSVSDRALGDPAQYIIQKLHLADVHVVSRGENVLVAVIDSEIDAKHIDIEGSIEERYDAGCASSTPDGHGTGMAGAIASHRRLLGVAPDVKIIAICAFGGEGQPQATSIKIIKGIDHAIRRGAKIINMSFSGPRDPMLAQAIQIAREKGVLVIAAAGNNGPKSPPLYPGADPNVMAVTAIDRDDRLMPAANQGNYISLAAPGVDVLVPAPGDGMQFSTGTSVATANASGVAALLLSHRPRLRPEDVRAVLVKSARHLGALGINPQFGAGVVDPVRALALEVSELSAAGSEAVQAVLTSVPTRLSDSFAALGYAEQSATKAAPRAMPSDWIAWTDLRGVNLNFGAPGSDLHGSQVTALAGVTHRTTPDFVGGFLGGYEQFNFVSQSLNGVLKGGGITAGTYFGWRFVPGLRFDAGLALSNILVNDAAGAAKGSFVARRVLATAAVNGTYNWHSFVFEPTANVYVIREYEDGFTDNLGTAQNSREFDVGRTSVGTKVAFLGLYSSSVSLTPFTGAFAEYYFSRDRVANELTTGPVLQGWSARLMAGAAARFNNGFIVGLTGEHGGLGTGTRLWTWRLQGSLPF